MPVDTRPALAADARTLPASYYTDPEQYRRELEEIHFKMWLHAGRSEEAAQAGDYFLVDVAGESVVVVRDQDGELRAFYNLCRHRGTRLCAESSGHFAHRIQCPYHAWTYALTGELLSAPRMEKTEGFQARDFPLEPVAVDTWDGHVFLNFASCRSSLAEHLGDLVQRFRPWGMEELRQVHEIVYPVRANWKLVIQNYSECLHCPVLHPQLNRVSHFLSGENDPPRPTLLGGRMELRDGCATQTADGRSPWTPLPGLDPELRRRVYYWAVLPNFLVNLHPDYMVTFNLWPRAHDSTDVVCRWYFHRDEIAKPGFDPSPAVEFWDLTNRQDWDVTERAQQGIGSRAYRPGPYSNREELLFALDRIVVERTGGKRH